LIMSSRLIMSSTLTNLLSLRFSLMVGPPREDTETPDLLPLTL
jgi:hypothetical protein